MNLLTGSTVLITGGAGSFGSAFVRFCLESSASKVIVFSRDEAKHEALRSELNDSRLRFFIGDVRDRDRLTLAFHGVDYVIHAAALKVVPAGEYDPEEFIKTNIGGAQNVIHAAIQAGVKRVVALSTDKACAPANLYGSTKLCAEKLFVAANSYSGGRGPRFSVTRYGNVAGSRGSVIPLWQRLADEGKPAVVTHPDMTRFHMTMDEAVELVSTALTRMQGGEVFVPKLPTYKVTDLACAISLIPFSVGTVRPGEKLAESLIGPDEARSTMDYGSHYRILPLHPWFDQDNNGTPVPDGFTYTSDSLDWRLTVEDLRRELNGVA